MIEKRTLKKLGIFAGIILGLWVLYRFTPLYEYFALDYIKERSLYFKQFVNDHYLLSVGIYMLVFISTIALSVPSSIILTLLGGYLFGIWHTSIISTISVTVGVTIAYIVYKYLLQDTLAQTYKDRAEQFEKQMREHGASYLLMLNFSTVFPYFVINAFAALSRVSVWTVVWTTAIGFIPQAFVYAYAGQGLGSIKKVNDIFSTNVIIAFVLLILLALVPMLIKRFKKTDI